MDSAADHPPLVLVEEPMMRGAEAFAVGVVGAGGFKDVREDWLG